MLVSEKLFLAKRSSENEEKLFAWRDYVCEQFKTTTGGTLWLATATAEEMRFEATRASASYFYVADIIYSPLEIARAIMDEDDTIIAFSMEG